MIVLATMRMFAWIVLLSQAVVPEERDAVGTDAFERDDDALMLGGELWIRLTVGRTAKARRRWHSPTGRGWRSAFPQLCNAPSIVAAVDMSGPLEAG